jgi:hypothetical protein|tara:strand:- start:777 stop:1478 length:702 start_codon:yes stop_codon:yes gene_type:complete
MSGISATTLKTMIKNYTEVDDTVLTDAILENIILNAQQRIMYDVPIDADRKQQSASLIVGQQTYNCPAGCLFIRGIQVYTATDGTITGDNTWLLKRDQTFLNEYIPANTSTGTPKYYAQFGGATGLSDTTSGKFMVAPTPSATFAFQIHFNVVQSILEGSGTNYISLNFPQGLLYCCLAETYGFLKGPTDMLTLYENKYKQEIEKFAAMQIGRRRRDDYTDGTVRIPIESPPQ